MNKSTGSEQRKFIRMEKNYVLSHQKYILGQEEKNSFEGVLKNYSAGGALFESKEKYEIGDLLKIEMTVLGWERFKNEFYKEDKLSIPEPVIILAKIVRIEILESDEMFDVGVCFVGIDDGHRWALIKQIDAQMKAKH